MRHDILITYKAKYTSSRYFYQIILIIANMYYIVVFAKRLGIPNISQYSYTRVQLLEYVAQSAYFYVPNVVQNVFGCESFISIHINNYTINIQALKFDIICKAEIAH